MSVLSKLWNLLYLFYFGGDYDLFISKTSLFSDSDFSVFFKFYILSFLTGSFTYFFGDSGLTSLKVLLIGKSNTLN